MSMIFNGCLNRYLVARKGCLAGEGVADGTCHFRHIDAPIGRRLIGG
jgi:hypothetical protein